MRLRDCYKEGLLRKTKPSKKYAAKSLDTSLNHIENAKDNFEMKNNNLVLFCSYTSMFHSARALLFKDGVKERSHICIVSYLKEKYPELRRLSNQLDAYRRNRHNTLYSLDFLISENDAKQAIDDAKEFYKQIKTIIDNE